MGGESRTDTHRLVKEMKESLYKDDQMMSGQGQPQYFKLSGYIQRILYDDQRQMYFTGCPECKKKVSLEKERFYRCEFCNKIYPEQDVRVTYTISARFQDASDSLFVNLLGE